MQPKIYIPLCLMAIALIILMPILVYKNKSRNNYQEGKYNTYKEKYTENFPSSSSLNLLYTDTNGNLGATSDVGIQNLTVASDSQINGNSTINGNATINGNETVSGTLSVSSIISSPTINEINNSINTINTTLTSLQAQITDLKDNIVRKDKLYAIVNNSTGENTTGNRNALLYGNYCSPDAKWKFVQQNSGQTC